ncbi:hypothetical protein HKD37_05G013046 [Glycine soja]
MASPPASPPPSPPPPPTPSPSTVKRTRKASHLRSLSTRPPGAERPVVHVDPATDKADGSYKKKLRTYLGIVARDKVDVTYENWKEVLTAQKDLIWEDIHAEFEIPEASDSRTKMKLLQTVGKRWRQFKSDLTRKWALAADQDGVDDAVYEKYDISKEKWAQFCQIRRDPSWEDVRKKAQAIQKQNTAPHVLSRGGYEYLEQKLLAEKTKKKLEEAAQSGSVDGIINPPSLVRRHVKWKMARTKKIGEMTTEAAKEIAEKIDSFEEQATQGSFVPHGHQDVLTAAIGCPKHPGRVRATGATADPANQGPARGVHHKKVTRQLMASFSHMQSQMQSQGLALPPEPLVGPSGPRVSTKGSCVDPSRNDLETGDSDRCGLYIEANPARLVALGGVYEGSTVVHNTPLLPGQVKVGVEEVTDTDAPVPVPTDEVSLVGQAIHTFLAWPTHLAVVSPAKPPQKPDPEVDDPLYLMTLTIPELFLRPYQVTWDATVFGVFNPNFPLYIKHEYLSEIAHSGQCLSILVLQLWILHLTETSMRVGNSDMYGFLEPQSIQRSGQSQFESESYIKTWMQRSKCDVYLGAYLNGALKGLDDAPQPKSKAPARWIVVKTIRAREIKGVADLVGIEMKVEQLFACHHITKERKVPLATLSFQGYALYLWTSLIRETRIHGDPPVEYWNDLKSALRKRHIPSCFERELMDKLQRLRQGSMSVEEYRQQMKLLLLRVGLREEEITSIARFLCGLNMEVREKVELLPYRELDELDQAQGILGVAPSKPKEEKGKTIEKFTPKTSSQARTSNIKCFKCLGRGHIASQCPTKKTMIIRGQDIYISQEETTSFPSSSGSEDEVRVEESSKEVYPHEEGDLLMVKRLLGGQSYDLSQSQRENIFHTRCKISDKTCSLIVDCGSCCNFCSTRLVSKLNL